MLGLSTALATAKLKEFGPNILKANRAHPWWQILFEQFTDVLVLILLGAGGVSFFVGEHTDAVVIFVIVFLNAGVGFIQEFRVERTLESLKKMIRPEIRVLRDGKEIKISTELLVPGDVVILAEGDRIPADGALIESHSLRIEESVLTGESHALEKKEKDQVFMGTSVAHGSGMFEVEHTGMHTRFGQIAKLTAETEKVPSTLQKELKYIGLFVTKLTGVICVVLFLVGIWKDFSLIESLLFAVSVAIAAVPEGLPTTTTIALALGATVLARKKAIMRKLSSVETLGAVTTICSDKTGTLTRNEMAVREVYLGDRSIFEVSGVGYNPNIGKVEYVGGADERGDKEKLLSELIEICALCNEAKLVQKKDAWRILGDPTEGALLTFAHKSGHFLKTWETLKLKNIFPFDSDRKMMSVLHGKKVLVKGSPDQVLEKCSSWSDGVKEHTMTPDKKEKIEAHYKRMAENALRVLAFAVRDTAGEKISSEGDAEKNLVFVGLVGMMDPPREEAREAVEKCHTAGIRTIVITGDYGVTAEAIARELGIVEGDCVSILTGEEVEKMSDKKLSQVLANRTCPVIFARSMPHQKMRIVQLLQKQGEVVAMTGDGVNDAPALKAADIGVAMGITGTEVSREAATMVLTDDSFSSIVTAVEEGRRIYENLKKFVWFIFSCNIGELFVVFSAILFSFPLPLTAILILCVDLGTDILPAIALGTDEAEKDLMKRPPRNVRLKVLNTKFVQHFAFTGIIIGCSVVGAFLWTLFEDSENIHHAQTIAFASLVCVQLVNAFSARSEKISLFHQNIFGNIFLWVGVITSLLLVSLIVYVPLLNQAIGTSPLQPSDWGVVALVSVVPLLFIEVWKWGKRRKKGE